MLFCTIRLRQAASSGPIMVCAGFISIFLRDEAEIGSAAEVRTQQGCAVASDNSTVHPSNVRSMDAGPPRSVGARDNCALRCCPASRLEEAEGYCCLSPRSRTESGSLCWQRRVVLARCDVVIVLRRDEEVAGLSGARLEPSCTKSGRPPESSRLPRKDGPRARDGARSFCACPLDITTALVRSRMMGADLSNEFFVLCRLLMLFMILARSKWA